MQNVRMHQSRARVPTPASRLAVGMKLRERCPNCPMPSLLTFEMADGQREWHLQQILVSFTPRLLSRDICSCTNLMQMARSGVGEDSIATIHARTACIHATTACIAAGTACIHASTECIHAATACIVAGTACIDANICDTT